MVKLLLLKAGADPNMTDSLGETPLTKASSLIQELIPIRQVKLEKHHYLGLSCSNMTKLLLEAGAKPYGRTPLSKAASNGQTDVVKLLLNNGANPNIR